MFTVSKLVIKKHKIQVRHPVYDMTFEGSIKKNYDRYQLNSNSNVSIWASPTNLN